MRVPRLLADPEHLAVKLRERSRRRRAVFRGIHSGHLEVVVEGRRARRPMSARAINPLRLLRGVHAHVSDDHLLHRGAAAVKCARGRARCWLVSYCAASCRACQGLKHTQAVELRAQTRGRLVILTE